MRKWIVLMVLVALLAAGCAASRTRVRVSPSFTKSEWLSNRIGVFPAITSAQGVGSLTMQDGVLKSIYNTYGKGTLLSGRHKINGVFAKMLQKKFPLEPPDITHFFGTIRLMARYKLLALYAKIDKKFKMLRYIDKESLLAIGKKLKFRYVMLPVLIGQGATQYKSDDSTQTMYAADLMLQIWDVKEKRVVLTAQARGTDSHGNIVLELLFPKTSWTSMDAAYVDGFKKILGALRWGIGAATKASNANKSVETPAKKGEQYYFGRD